MEVSVKKRGSRRFSQKENADFLINVLGLPPIDQRVFSVEISVKKGYADSRRKGDADFWNKLEGVGTN